MARRKSLDTAFTSVVDAVVRDAIREQLQPLKREIAALRRAVSKTPGSRALPVPGKKRGRKPIFTQCQVADCSEGHQSRGFCQRHYNRLRNRGTLDRWAKKLAAGEVVRESMIAPQRGIPLNGSSAAKSKKKKSASSKRRRKAS